MRKTKTTKDDYWLPQETRLEVYYAGSCRCHYCGVSLMVSAFEVDHKKCRYAGGTDDLANLVAACSECNEAKGVRDYRSFRYLLQKKGLAWRDEQAELRQKLYKRRSVFRKALRTPYYKRNDLMRFAIVELDLLKRAKQRRRV